MEFALLKWLNERLSKPSIDSMDYPSLRLVEALESRTLLSSTLQIEARSPQAATSALVPAVASEAAPLSGWVGVQPTVSIVGENGGALSGGGPMWWYWASGQWWFQSPNEQITFAWEFGNSMLIERFVKTPDDGTLLDVSFDYAPTGTYPEDTEYVFHMVEAGHDPGSDPDCKIVLVALSGMEDGDPSYAKVGPELRDTDGDGTPDVYDTDDDGDGNPDPGDDDDDGDGVLDEGDLDHPGNPAGNYATSDNPVDSTTGNAGEIGDQVALSGRNGSVDIHGVPISEPSPTGEGESDRVPNMAKIDAFSLTPSFSTTDIAIPMPGDELLMEFRRTLGIGLKTYHPYSPSPTIDTQFPSETILGPAWSTNIGSHVILSTAPSHAADEPPFRATVYDEVGNPISYFSTDNTYFRADVRSTFSNASLKGTLQRDVAYGGSTYDLAYIKEHGTRLFFEIVETLNRGNVGQTNPPTDTYYRLDRIVDRNGNEIRYDYVEGNPTLVQSIYDPSLGDASVSSRRIDFAYTFLDSPALMQWRLISVADPLGRVFNYQYDAAGQLASVLKPDPEIDRLGQAVRPTVSITYERKIQLKAYVKSNSQGVVYNGLEYEVFISPKTITDARSNVTTFNYDYNRWTPTGIRSEGNAAVFLYQLRPLITSVTTVDGTATFNPLTLTEFKRTIAVTDTRGVTTTYTFGSGSSNQLVDAPNSLGWAIALDQMKREVDVADADGNITTKSVTFKYSSDINGNLIEVDDMSGNILRYVYDSQDSSDPYNEKPFGTDYGTRYQIYSQPAQRVMAADELNLTTDYRYDTNFNKLIREVDPEGKITTYTLDADGNRTVATAAAGSTVQAITSYQYNAQGFMTKQTDADGRVTEYVPNAYGNLEYTIVKGLTDEDLTPLASTSPFSTQDPQAKWLVSRRIADVMDRTTQSVDPRGNTTSYTYDNWDRVTSTTLPPVEDPGQNGDGDPLYGPIAFPTTSKVYDFNSNVVQEADVNGNVTLHEYDAFNRQTLSRRRMVSPSANNVADIVQQWTYDAVGLVNTQTDPLGRVTDHDYDALLREIRTTLPQVTVVTDPASTSATPSTTTAQYVTKTYFGPKSGSGAFTLGGFNPTRIIDARGYASDTVYDDAYRAIRSIHRHDSASTIASTDAARSDEPETDTVYNKAGKPIATTIRNETRLAAAADRTTYTFYDDLLRPTVVAVDMLGNGAGWDPATTFVNDASLFSAQNDDLVSRTAYDFAGHVRLATDANGRVSETIYDGAGRAIQSKMPMVDLFTSAGGVLQDQIPITFTVYDAASNPIRVTDPNGNQTQTEYDALNRPVRTILDHDGDGSFESIPGASSDDIVTITGYDRAGNKVYSIDPNGNRTDMTYDRADRVVLVKAPEVDDAEAIGSSRPETSTTYDKNGNFLTVTDPRGIVTETQYDELNRSRFVIANSNSLVNAPDRLVTETRYDASGNKLALVLYNRVNNATRPQVTTYAYDAFGRQVSETLPSIGDSHTRQTTTNYNRAGQPITVTDPKDQEIQTDYDRAGRATETRFYRTNNTLEETRTSLYDKVGNLTSSTDLNGTSGYAYDSLNRQTAETRENNPGTGVQDQYTIYSYYDANGNRTKVVYPNTGRTLTSQFDRANRLVAMSDATTPGSSFGYDSAGNRVSETIANGVTNSASFDSLNRVTSLSTEGTYLHYSVSYGYDLSGNRRSASESVINQASRELSWTYDGLYRLIQESWSSLSDAQTRGYTYDPAGNRLTRAIDYLDTNTSDTTTDYVYDDLNELLLSDDGQLSAAYSYDRNGNRLVRDSGPVISYQYDTSDRLVSVEDENEATIFSAKYDARTRRLGKTENGTTTVYRYDGGTNFQELQDTNNDNALEVQTELVRAGGLGGGIGSVLYTDKSMAPTSGPVEFFVYDAVGNTVVTFELSEDVTQSTLYDAFGQTVAQVGGSTNNRLHNTKERDASIGLDNHGFRYYDPETATYIQRDPSGYSDGMNVYQSVHDNPINGVDPLGLWEWPWSKNASWRPVGTSDAAWSGFQEAVQQTQNIGTDLKGLPRGMKDAVTNTAMTVAVHGGNALGLVSDETMQNDSPLVQYWAGHIAAGTTPVVQEMKDLGSGLASGDPAAYRKVGIGALTAAAGMKMGSMGTRPLGVTRGVSEAMGEAGAGEGIAAESPHIAPGDLAGKTRSQIRDLANDKRLVPKGDPASSDYPRKWSDPVTGDQRVRLDRGHIDSKGQPYNNPNAAVDHVHGYDKSGKPIQVDGDHHIPTAGE